MSKKPFKPSPHLSDEINKSIIESELQGGCRFDEWPEGKTLVVQTANTRYEIRKTGADTFIRGNARYCPEWTECTIIGSTFGGSMLKVNFVGRGMYLEVFLVGAQKTITTSCIKEVLGE